MLRAEGSGLARVLGEGVARGKEGVCTCLSVYVVCYLLFCCCWGWGGLGMGCSVHAGGRCSGRECMWEEV